MDEGPGRRRRRTHNAAFKAEAVAACHRADASIAACALERSINANLLRRWVIEAERAQCGSLLPAPAVAASSESFVPVALPRRAANEAPIRIEVRRGTLTVSVQWPSSAMHECAIWLRELIQ
ncbi:MAG: transposase [Terriglobales bacterium]